MENNKAYLNKLPIIFLIALAGAAAQEFFFNTVNRSLGNEEQMRINLLISQSIYFIIQFVGLGLALNKWKQAIGALVTAAIIIAVSSFLYKGSLFGGSTTGVTLNLITSELLYISPGIVFFALAKPSGKKIAIVIITLIVLRGLMGAFFISRGVDVLKDDFRIDLSDYKQFITVLISTCLYIFKILFYCELQNYVDAKGIKWQPRLLNPGNVYDKLSATIVFFVLKVFLLAMAIGQAFQLYGLKYFLREDFDSFLKPYYYSNILNIIFGVTIALFGAWYLRKTILEYFISYNITSKFTYWLMLLPGIGFIVWLFCLQDERNKNFSEKVDAINGFASSPSQAVTVIIVILMCLRLIFGLTGAAVGISIFSGILSLALFAWLTNQRSGYYFNLYLSLGLLLVVLVAMFGWGERRYLVLFSAVFSLLLYNAVQLVMIYPVYHFEDFSYLDDGDEKPEEEGAILAGFES